MPQDDSERQTGKGINNFAKSQADTQTQGMHRQTNPNETKLRADCKTESNLLGL